MEQPNFDNLEKEIQRVETTLKRLDRNILDLRIAKAKLTQSIPMDTEVKPACETLMKTLERVIKYYNDLQTEAPDNLSLGMLHTNMVILIEQFEEYKSKSV